MSTTDTNRQTVERAVERPGHWVAAFAAAGGRATEGAPALELDHVEGNAPRVAGDDAHRVIFDGRLYNRRELADAGGASEDTDEAGVILGAYRRLGQDLVPRIKGRFALLIWDAGKRELLCVRDPLGTYPLFYATTGERILLSTGLEDLVDHPEVSTELNRLVLAEHLACRWPEMEDTYYAAIRRVPPGHVLAMGAGPGRLYRYWDPVPDPGSDDWVEGDELDRFEEVFDQAVSRALDLGPSGIFLSGGLDSVSVAAVATDLARRRDVPPPVALSLKFPHPDADEEAVQRGVAAQLGLTQVMVNYDEAVGPAGRAGAAVAANATRSMPVLGLWEAGYWRLAAEGRERGCNVILTGGGGDEMLVPSPYLGADLIAQRDFAGFWRLFQELRRSYPWTTPQMINSTFWKFGLRAVIVRGGRRTLNRVAPSVLRNRWRRQIREGTPTWLRTDPQLDSELMERAEHIVNDLMPRSSSFYYDKCRASLDFVTASMEMERTFEDGRKAGVVIQEPYWDADLQDYLYRVRPEVLQQGGRTKGLVRQMLSRRFPDLGFERQKKIIANEFANDIFVNEIPDLLREMGGATALAELGIVDKRLVDHAIDNARDPSMRQKSFLLWHVLSLESWLRSRT